MSSYESVVILAQLPVNADAVAGPGVDYSMRALEKRSDCLSDTHAVNTKGKMRSYAISNAELDPSRFDFMYAERTYIAGTEQIALLDAWPRLDVQRYNFILFTKCW